MLVPYNDPDLLHATGNAAQSPYVIAITRAGIKGLPSVINAAVLTSALSAGNSFLFCSSRILYGLALRGQAPRIFARCTKDGLPYAAILFAVRYVSVDTRKISKKLNDRNLAGKLRVLSVHEHEGVVSRSLQVSAPMINENRRSRFVDSWLVNLSTVGGFLSWLGINITFIQFCSFYPYHQYILISLMCPLPYCRSRKEGSKHRPSRNRILQQLATIPRHLGRLLVLDIHPRQWLRRLLRFQDQRLPCRVHQYSRVPLRVSFLEDI